MIALICDSDITDVNDLSDILFKLKQIETKKFNDYNECITYIEYNPVDMIFLSVSREDVGYQSLIRKMKAYNIPICLTSAEEEDCIKVFECDCDRFLQKPYSASAVIRCLKYFDQIGAKRSGIIIRTFGRFEVFASGTPVIFHNAKAKELLALCVDKRGAISCAEAIDKLWPSRAFDDKTKRLYRKAIASIHSTLDKYNISNIFQSYRGGCTVNTGAFKCDYYSFIDDPKTNLYTLNGKYMSDFDWAEFTLANIIRIAEAVNTSKDLSFLYE